MQLPRVLALAPNSFDIDPADQTWQLGIEAMREFQRLPIYGKTGLAASEQTNAEATLEFFRQQEKDTLPLDLAAFYRYTTVAKSTVRITNFCVRR